MLFGWSLPGAHHPTGYRRIYDEQYAPRFYAVAPATAAHPYGLAAAGPALRPEISCTMSVMDYVCDTMPTQKEQHACRQGAVNAHTLHRGAYFVPSTPQESSAFSRGYYSTFAGCPLR